MDHLRPICENAGNGVFGLSEFIVEMSGITKRFGSLVALDNVDLRVRPQTLHAVVGENGAGKTTLMKVLQGTYRADAGEVRIRGEVQNLRSTSDGYAHGIGMVSQHYSIIPELTCLQNLMLGTEPSAIIDPTIAAARAQEVADRLGVQFDWGQSARELSPASAQKLEILKLLWRKSAVMILDEPTAMLSPADSEALYANLKSLAQAGATIIVVTHRLPEVMSHCEQISVLRAGKVVSHQSVTSTTVHQLAEMIVGRSYTPTEPPAPRERSAIALRLDSVTVRGDRGNDAVKSATADVFEGEVIGVAGVDGNGQRELFHALVGHRSLAGGSISLGNAQISELSIKDRISHGVRLIAEDRHIEAVVEDWSIADNGLLGHHHESALRQGAGFKRAAILELAERLVKKFAAKCDGIRATMRSLSGGNQQKIVAARAMEFEPKLILAFQPTRGLDIGATQEVFGSIRSACDQGAVALIASFDLDELIENCDRVFVMNHGELHVPPAGRERDRQLLGELMVGA